MEKEAKKDGGGLMLRSGVGEENGMRGGRGGKGRTLQVESGNPGIQDDVLLLLPLLLLLLPLVLVLSGHAGGKGGREGVAANHERRT